MSKGCNLPPLPQNAGLVNASHQRKHRATEPKLNRRLQRKLYYAVDGSTAEQVPVRHTEHVTFGFWFYTIQVKGIWQMGDWNNVNADDLV